MNYKKNYLKYKLKYLVSKKILSGGAHSESTTETKNLKIEPSNQTTEDYIAAGLILGSTTRFSLPNSVIPTSQTIQQPDHFSDDEELLEEKDLPKKTGFVRKKRRAAQRKMRSSKKIISN